MTGINDHKKVYNPMTVYHKEAVNFDPIWIKIGEDRMTSINLF